MFAPNDVAVSPCRRRRAFAQSKPTALSPYLAAFLVVLVTAAAAMQATAGVINSQWQGGVGDWNDPNNWTSVNYPNNGGGDTYKVFIDGGQGATSSVVTLNTPVAIDTLAVDADDALNIANSQTLTIVAGALTNDGAIDVGATTAHTYLRIDGATTLSGGGELRLGHAGLAHVRGLNTNHRLTNAADHTICGAGQLGDNYMTLTNLGTVQADTFGERLTIDASAGADGVVNQGLIRALNGAELHIVGSEVNNSGGVIEFTAGTSGHIQSSQVSGGSVDNQATLTLNASEVGADTFTNNGTLIISGGTRISNHLSNLAGKEVRIGNSATLTLAAGGSYTNDGEVNISPTSSHTYLRIDGATTLSGDGELRLGHATLAYVQGVNANHRLTNAAGHTICGTGQLGGNRIMLTNLGTVQADTSGERLTIDASAGADGVVNQGLIRALNGAELHIVGSEVNNSGGLIEFTDGTSGHIQSSQVSGGSVDNRATLTLNASEVGADTFTNNGTLIISGGTRISSHLSNLVGKEVRIGNSATLTLAAGGSYTNDGEVNISPTSSHTYLRIDGATTLSGDGELRLGHATLAYVQGVNATDRLTNAAGHTICGTGRLGNNYMTLTNLGTVQADVSGQRLTIDASAGADGVVNQGLIRALNGAELYIVGSEVNNSGGLIEFTDGTSGHIQSSQVSGGSVDNRATLTLNASEVGADTFTNNGTLIISGGSRISNHLSNLVGKEVRIGNAAMLTLAAGGSYTNNGEVNINPTSSHAYLRIDGATTLSGGGELQLSHATLAYVQGVNAADRLTNAAGHTIRGAGRLGNNYMTLTNLGTIQADVSGERLTIDASAGADGVVNQGLIQALNGAELYIVGSTVNNSGRLIIDAGSTGVITSSTLTNEPAGVIGGGGELDIGSSTFVNQGIIAPGQSAGVLSVTGNVPFDPTAQLWIELGGTEVGSGYDRLSVDGQVTLGGDLMVELIDGFVPDSLDIFTVLVTDRPLVGTFANTPGNLVPVFPFGEFQVTYDTNSVVLDNFVPEPATLALLAFGGMALLARRRK